MPSNFGFVATAYTLVLGSLAGYALWIRARRARARAELREHGSNHSAKAHSGRVVSH